MLGRARLRGPDAFFQILWPETFAPLAAATSSAVVPSSATPDFSFEASCQATVSEDTAAALASEVGPTSGAAFPPAGYLAPFSAGMRDLAKRGLLRQFNAVAAVAA